MKSNIFIDSYEVFLNISYFFKNYVEKIYFSEEDCNGIRDIFLEAKIENEVFLIHYKSELYQQLDTLLEDNKQNKNYLFTEDALLLEDRIDLIDNPNIIVVLFFINGEFGHINFEEQRQTLLNYLNKNNKIVTSIIHDKDTVNLLKIKGLNDIVNHKNYKQSFYSYFITAKPILGYFFDVKHHKFEHKKNYDFCYYERPGYKRERDNIKKLLDNSNLRINKISEISSKWKNQYEGEFHNKKTDSDFIHKILGVFSNDNSYLFSKFYHDYVDSHLGICFETIHDDRQEFFMTEKVFKFLYYGIPFYNIASKKLMSKLKEMGFFSYDMLIRSNENRNTIDKDFKLFLTKYDSSDRIEELTKNNLDKFKKNMELVNYYINEENDYRNDLMDFIF